MKKTIKIIISLLLVMLLLASCTPAVTPVDPTEVPTEAPTAEPTAEPEKPMEEILAELQSMQFTSSKNVIVFIADGCGQNHVPATDAITGGRYSGKLALEFMPNTFIVDTTCVDGEPDSASGGTAYATGYKSNRGVIGMNTKKEVVQNVTELAHSLGKSTGIITSENICDATPATFTIHSKDRKDETKIAALQITDCVADFIIGGGLATYEQLMQNEPDYAAKLIENNVTWAKTWDDVKEFDGNGRLIATMTEDYWFEASSMPATLAEMTQYGIDQLSKNENGFFLMVEAGALDEVAHQSDVMELTRHMTALDEAVEVALRYLYKNQDTVIIVTADHNTGRLLAKDEADAYIEKNKKSDNYIANDEWCVTNAKLHCVLAAEEIAKAKNPTVDYDKLPYRFTTIAHTSDKVQTWAIGYNTESLTAIEKCKSFNVGQFIGTAISGQAFGATTKTGTK